MIGRGKTQETYNSIKGKIKWPREFQIIKDLSNVTFKASSEVNRNL